MNSMEFLIMLIRGLREIHHDLDVDDQAFPDALDHVVSDALDHDVSDTPTMTDVPRSALSRGGTLARSRGREHGQGRPQEFKMLVKRWLELYNDVSLDYKNTLASVEAKNVAKKNGMKNFLAAL
nr:hypothetical protein CFP56_02380 [Quercus suber]